MEKVFPADRHSGVAIAGAAGPAMEMVKLFQLQLEHYEKVEGTALSLEGKANQLARWCAATCRRPCRAWPSCRSSPATTTGAAGRAALPVRRHRRPLRGADHAATGSGSLHAGTVVKLGYRDGLDPDDAVDLAIQALFEAADEDSATGGPDLVRGIFPVVATITADGFERVADDELADPLRGGSTVADRRRAPAPAADRPDPEEVRRR
jgi:proteasome beta subunit